MLPGGKAVRARTLDLGAGGAGVVCDVNVPMGTPVSLHIMLPSRLSASAPFEVVAVVVNSTFSATNGGFRVGLRFGSLQVSALTALKAAFPDSFSEPAA